jgi:hypothetical protein
VVKNLAKDQLVCWYPFGSARFWFLLVLKKLLYLQNCHSAKFFEFCPSFLVIFTLLCYDRTRLSQQLWLVPWTLHILSAYFLLINTALTLQLRFHSLW